MTEIIKSICPATGDVVWEGAATSAAEVHAAVAKARKAFADWSLTSFDHRADIAKKYAEAVREKSEDIALAISRDMGKPLWEARTEANAMAIKSRSLSTVIMNARRRASRRRRASPIARMASWPCSGRLISRGICPMGILFRRSSRGTRSFSNPQNSPRKSRKLWARVGTRRACPKAC